MLDETVPDKGELTDKFGECDTAVYSCLLLSAQQEVRSSLMRTPAAGWALLSSGCVGLRGYVPVLVDVAVPQVERARQEAADKVAAAEIRAQVADKRCARLLLSARTRSQNAVCPHHHAHTAHLLQTPAVLRVEEAEESKATALASVAEPLHILVRKPCGCAPPSVVSDGTAVYSLWHTLSHLRRS